VLLLDERGRPLFVNRAAEALLAEGDGLTLRRGRLHAATGALVLPDDVQFERPSGRLKG
jgi:PAS domain-containing protein